MISRVEAAGPGAMPPRQLPLSLPHQAAMTRADFLVSDANRAAVALIDAWPHWPPAPAVIVGPPGSGKTHLVEIWRAASGAAVSPANAIADAESMVGRGAVAIEDLHAGPIDEAAMFHLLNRATERGAPLLMTSRKWPAALPIRLPDLASRLRAMRLVELGEPDDALLRQVLVKLFSDRQLAVEPALVDTILLRMVRSLDAANAIVAELDREALAEGKPITRRMAVVALARIQDGQPDLFGE